MDDAEKLPDEFDVIVVGTGLTECILAAACSRIGLKVLHLDRNENYSAEWATFNWKALEAWIEQKGEGTRLSGPGPEHVTSLLQPGETVLDLNLTGASLYSHVTQRSYVPEARPTPPPSDTPAQHADTPAPSEANQDSLPGTVAGEAERTANSKETGITAETDDPVKSEDLSETSHPVEPVTAEPKTGDEAKSEGAGNAGSSAETKDSGDSCKAPGSAGADNTCAPTDESEKQLTMEDIRDLGRRFNIDLAPKLLWSRGGLVELLIQSDVAKYCEFRAVSQVLTLRDAKLLQVPCSRADVFKSKEISMLEKRMLMKLLTLCLQHDTQRGTWADFADRPFVEFLKSQKVTPLVQHHVIHAIAMVTEDTPTEEALAQTKHFLTSLGRYGNTPFLWPMYGAGELPQAFCRLAAVFGATYCLRRSAAHAVVDAQTKCVGVVCDRGQRMACRWLVLEASSLPEGLVTSSTSRVSRAVLLTDKPLMEPSDHVILLRLPATEGCGPVTVIELPPSSAACPKGFYLLHLTAVCEEDQSAEEHLRPALDRLVTAADVPTSHGSGSKPRMLWSCFFSHATPSQTTSGAASLPDNTSVCPGPDSHLGFEAAITKAREIFSQMCPGEEFLPRAPNPEDIVTDDPSPGDPPTEEASPQANVTDHPPTPGDPPTEEASPQANVTDNPPTSGDLPTPVDSSAATPDSS